MNDILDRDATGQLQALADRTVSASELLEAVLARADRRNPAVNAVVARDVDGARAAARAIDGARTRGAALGPLAGLPMTVKDTLDVAGLPASAGLAEFLGRPCEDAVVVARARAAGAVIWGKTNTPVKAADWQTYNVLYGTTNNPWDSARTPGGSSGGSAAALAAGITALEIGADIGGSLRIPAGFCGVFAHKPTFGVVSQRGLVPPAEGDIDMAVVGPMARSARDLRLLLSVIADVPRAAPLPQLKDLKIALWLDDADFIVDAPVRTAIVAFARRLAAAGATVMPVRAPVETETLMRTYTTLLYAVLGAELTPGQRTLYNLFRPAAKLARAFGADALSMAQALLGHTARQDEWLAADAVRAELGATMAAFFKGYDVLLAPVSPVPAFVHDHSAILRRRLTLSDGRRTGYRAMMKWIALATVCGLPSTSVPAGLTADGLPAGVQLIGPHGSDDRTLAVAQAIDEEVGGFTPPPAYSAAAARPNPSSNFTPPKIMSMTAPSDDSGR